MEVSHTKIPLFFCVTIFITQVLDLISTELCLSLGYEEMNPLYGLPVTVAKLLLPLVYYGIYIFGEKRYKGDDFKTFTKAYRNALIMYTVIYCIILINNFSVLIGR